MAVHQSGRKKALWLWSGVFGGRSQPVAQADRRKPCGFQAKSSRGRLSFFVGAVAISLSYFDLLDVFIGKDGFRKK